MGLPLYPPQNGELARKEVIQNSFFKKKEKRTYVAGWGELARLVL